jgi:UDP-N-acetylglucosamine 2-epimerase (non-hydrolysing)
VLADLHFTPTRDSDANLIREGVPPEHIEVTGNTVIDALLWMRDKLQQQNWRPAAESPLNVRDDQRMVLITGHRRENFGSGFERICLALAELALRYPDVQFLYPVHLNPQVQQAVYSVLSGRETSTWSPPGLPALRLADEPRPPDPHRLRRRAGRSPALGKPVLVLRKVTERPAVLKGGTVKLVGTLTERIVHETSQLLDDPDAYARMAQVFTPFGDGHASERIAERLSRWFAEQSTQRANA